MKYIFAIISGICVTLGMISPGLRIFLGPAVVAFLASLDYIININER